VITAFSRLLWALGPGERPLLRAGAGEELLLAWYLNSRIAINNAAVVTSGNAALHVKSTVQRTAQMWVVCAA
jgi:hypothetical protein